MRSVLDSWISKKHNLEGEEQLRRWQEEKIRELFVYVCEKSSFYRKHFAGYSVPKNRMEWERLPFLTAKDLEEHGLEMLCVSQGEIERVVTLNTSGTSGSPKRLYFTKEDLELTVDFFCAGMGEVVKPGEKTAVFLHCKRAGSVGELLQKGLGKLGAKGYGKGPVNDPGKTLIWLSREGIEAFVGTPLQALALAEHEKAKRLPLQLKKILVSTDFLADSARRRIEEGLNCQVYNHFGITEAGLGAAVECGCHEGMHIRENDLLFETVDPISGQPAPDSMEGELVLTTLTRRGMPLIRYRTGDYGVLDRGICRCKSRLTRITGLGGRIGNALGETGNRRIGMPDLDECLFSIDGLLDYGVEYREREKRLDIRLVFFGQEKGKAEKAKAYLQSFIKEKGLQEQIIRLGVAWEETDSWIPQYQGKRYIKKEQEDKV